MCGKLPITFALCSKLPCAYAGLKPFYHPFYPNVSLVPSLCSKLPCAYAGLKPFYHPFYPNVSLVPRPSYRPVFDYLKFLHTVSNQKLDSGKSWEWGYPDVTHVREDTIKYKLSPTFQYYKWQKVGGDLGIRLQKLAWGIEGSIFTCTFAHVIQSLCF